MWTGEKYKGRNFVICISFVIEAGLLIVCLRRQPPPHHFFATITGVHVLNDDKAGDLRAQIPYSNPRSLRPAGKVGRHRAVTSCVYEHSSCCTASFKIS